MVVSLQAYVEHPDLALTPTIKSLPNATLGVVSDAGTDPTNDTYFFWVDADDASTVESAFDADPTIASYERIIDTEGRRTYGIEYADGARLITPRITDLGGLVIDSRSHSSGWLFTLQFRDHATLNRFNEFVSHSEFHFDIFELQQGDSTETQPDYGLTDAQREALVTAYVHGYFDEPRETSLEELGTILGISQTAVSGRLRRGAGQLIETVLE